jgi:transcriptional regulator with XRE-family HTH domain
MMKQTPDEVRGLAALRRARGLTQEQLAVEAGVGSATVYRLEGGHGRPRRTTLRVLAWVLGCDPADLLVETSEARPATGLHENTAGQGRYGRS